MSQELSSMFVTIGADLSGLTRGLTQAKSQMAQMGTSTNSATTGLGGLEAGAKRTGIAFSGMGMAMAGAATTMLSLPFLAVGKAALEMGMGYEKSLNMMQAVTGATADQMQRISKLAVALGADMTLPATSAADAATAMTELAKSGLSVNDVMTAAKGTLQLAAAGNLSEARAAEIASNALNAFHLAGSEATRVANLLAAAANTSSGEVTDMADSLQMSAAVFSAAGIPIEHLVASIGEMANAGIKGSDAGTSLKQMLLSLEAPTEKASTLMKELGISIYDAQGNMKPLPEIIDNFSTSLAKYTPEARNAALATIFGSDAVRAANIVMLGGKQAFDDMTVAVTKAGAAQELAGARMKGLSGAIQGLQSQVETLMLNAIMPLLPHLENLTRYIADLVTQFQTIPAPIQTAIIVATGLIGVLLALTGAVLGAVSVGIMLAPVFGAAAAAVGTAIVTIVAPIALLLGAMALLYFAWTQNWGDIQGKTQTAVVTISGLLDELVSIINNMFAGNWQTIWDNAGQSVQRVAEWIGNILGWLGGVFEGIFGAIGTLITDVMAGNWNKLGADAAAVGESVANSMGSMANSVAASAGAMAASVSNALSSVLTNYGTVIEGMAGADLYMDAMAGIQGIEKPKMPTMPTIGGAGGLSLPDIGKAGGGGGGGGAKTDTAAQAVTSIASAIKNAVEAIDKLNSIKGIAQDKIELLTEGIKKVVSAIAEIAGGWDNINKDALLAADNFSKTTGVIMDAVNKSIDAMTALTKLKAITEESVSSLREGITALVAVFFEMANDWSAIGKDALDGASEFAGAVGPMMDTISKSIDALTKLRTFKAVAESHITAFMDALGMTLQLLYEKSIEMGQDMADTAKEFALSIGPAIESIGKTIDFFTKLRDFKAVTEENIFDFVNAVSVTIIFFAAKAVEIGQDMAETAATFLNTIGPGIDSIGKSIDFFTKLKDFKAITEENVFDFVNAVTTTVIFFLAKAQEIGQDMVDIAAEFMNSVGPAVDNIGKSIDFFIKLKDFKAITIENVFDFVNAVTTTLIFFLAKAQEIGQEMGDIAAQFLNSIGPAITSIGSSIDFFIKLKDFKGVTETNVLDFVNATITTLVFFYAKAIEIGQDMADVAAKFMSTIGPAITAVGQAIDAFVKLQDFKAVPEENIRVFVEACITILKYFYDQAVAIGQEVANVAAKFMSTLGPAIGAIGQAIDTLIKLRGFVPPAEENIRFFVESVITIMRYFYSATGTITQEMADIVKKWADNVGPAISEIGANLDFFTKLRWFVKPLDDNIAAFVDTVIVIMQMFHNATGRITQKMAETVKLWADSVGPAISEIGANLDFFTKLRWFVPPLAESIQMFVDSVSLMMLMLYEKTKQISMKVVDTVKVWTDVVGPAIDNMGKALEVLQKLRGFLSVQEPNVRHFADQVDQLIIWFYDKAVKIGIRVADTAKIWMDAVGPAVETIGKALDVLQKLRGYLSVQEPNVRQFADQVDQLIIWFYDKAWRIGIRVADTAKIFMDTVGPAVETIGKAFEAISNLKGFSGVHTPEVRAFVDAIDQVLIWFYRKAIVIGQYVADTGAEFMKTIGPGIEAIGKSFDFISKLRGFILPTVQNVTDFVEGVAQVLVWFYRRAVEIGQYVPDTAAVWMNAIAPAIESIGKSLDFLSKLREFVAPTVQNVQDFVEAIAQVLAWFYRRAIEMGQYVADVAAAWMNTMGPAVASIGGAIDTLAKLKDYSQIGKEHIEGFVNNLVEAMDLFAGIAGVWPEDLQEKIKGLLTTMDAIVDTLTKASGLKDLTPMTDQVKAFRDAVVALLQDIAVSFTKAISEIGVALDTLDVGFMESMSIVQLWRDEIVQAIKDVIAALATLPPTTIEPAVAVTGAVPMASGGIVTKPTLALIGERGPEAVTPLNRAGTGGNITVNIMAPVYGVNQLEDVVVGAVEKAQRRGRLALA